MQVKGGYLHTFQEGGMDKAGFQSETTIIISIWRKKDDEEKRFKREEQSIIFVMSNFEKSDLIKATLLPHVS